jgi:hypothetical protein
VKPSVKPVRCAIYTRVSTDHGLDQEFNSLDAQYDAGSVRNAVGIRFGAFSENMKVSFQATRSIG